MFFISELNFKGARTHKCVLADEWFARLDAASEEEEDMLDLAAGVARTSRLSCQIDLAPDLDGLTVRLPAESYDMSR